MINLAAALCAVAAFGTMAYRALRAANYAVPLSGFYAALAAGQIFLALKTATLPSLLFVFVVYLITVSAVAFARVQNVRNIALLSGAVALVQGINPLGPVMALVLVPAIIALQDASVFRARKNSLLILLLFIPLAGAGFVTYLAQTTPLTPAAWAAANVARISIHRAGPLFTDLRLQGLAHAVELAVIALPVWITAGIVRNRASLAIGAVCAAVILSATVAAFFGHPRPVALVAPGLAMPSVLALCEWRQMRGAARLAFAAPALGVFTAWLCAELAA